MVFDEWYSKHKSKNGLHIFQKNNMRAAFNAGFIEGYKGRERYVARLEGIIGELRRALAHKDAALRGCTNTKEVKDDC